MPLQEDERNNDTHTFDVIYLHDSDSKVKDNQFRCSHFIAFILMLCSHCHTGLERSY